MAHVVLDHSLNSMTQENELVDCFRTLGKWTAGSTDINPFAPYNPIMWWVQYYYSRKMTRILGGILEDRFATKNSSESYNSRTMVTSKRGKPAIDLALDEYAKEVTTTNGGDDGVGRDRTGGIDSTFKTTAIDSMKSFLFAGHDTSSSTICFIFHCLSMNPEQAARLRQEHDDVFGVDIEETGERLKQEPNLANQLPYTAAVIKGLFPPSGAV